ncbi:CBS domain-containing protein/Voltage_CLC domain-containing protein [Cephalotus follicularis]|uniref:Chloride channel protein n=1 Tax=Cephalotus follicularis TaxID=3775 RepID=A0A1Q3BN38_CEPFO|nr:CBS domain-containing protein/Voltage_CLC domain-containing protein [Cephalotus follicularis]
MTGGGEYSDERQLLRSQHSQDEAEADVEEQDQQPTQPSTSTSAINNNNNPSSFKTNSFKHLFKHLDRGFSSSSNRRTIKRDHHHHHDHNDDDDDDVLGDSAPPEWALLLIGCLLGLATGLFVAAFNKGVHIIHEWAWAGTPNEGAAWLRLQRLADTWHRILLIPVTGGVIVGMMHGLVEILDQIKQSTSSQQQGFDPVAGIFPTIKAIQAAVTLGTGCSLGPEGPSVDIGKSCAKGFSLMMENNRERRIALVAAGAAAGIASGFNAAVAGCFFAIETVLRPLRAENSPPFTTAMIILASVISSTVSNVLLGTQSAFTVPAYDLKSAAELPLYLILGMLCGVVSVAFTRLVAWFTKFFDFIKERFGLPAVVCPALGGLGAGIIALKYPGILYWGFTNVEEILHTGKTASAPGIWLLTQLAAAKVVATALCKGSGLVGGLYAPSLMIGSAVGAVFGGLAAELINSAIPGNAAVAQPQAYALVGMAATLASVCSVPLTSVLLLFELTKDYRILLPLMGAVGLAIWVPSMTNQVKETEVSDTRNLARGYSSLSPNEDKNDNTWRGRDVGDDLELSIIETAAGHDAINEDMILEDLKVSRAMSKKNVKVLATATLKEAMKCMTDSKQNCVLVVDDEDFLEGILTYGDIKRCLSKKPSDNSKGEPTAVDVNTCLVSSVCTRRINYRGQERAILTCYADTDLAIAKELMEAKGIKQLPVVKRGGPQKGRKKRVIAILHYDSIWSCLREVMDHPKSVYQHRKENNLEEIIVNGR